MGRARGDIPEMASRRPQQRRQAKLGDLSHGTRSARANVYARALCQSARLGEFDDALAELAVATDLGAGASPQLIEVRDAVARELTRRAEHLYEDLLPRAVHTLGISPLTTDQMVVDGAGSLHLVSRRVPNDDAIGEELHTACGQRLWSGLEAPLQAGMRGSWQAHEAHQVVPCAGCAVHASKFPATDDPGLTPEVARTLNESISGQVCAQLSQRMAELSSRGAIPALEAAEEHYARSLTEHLVARARDGGDEVMRHILLRYYDSARRDLDDSGYSGTISSLVSEKDWNEVVSNTLEDLAEDDNGAVARSYLYGEIRAIVGQRIHHQP